MGRRSEKIIVDAGALVAIINKRDQYHRWARSQSYQLTPPFLTCEAALSEAWYLLRKDPYLQEKLLRLFTGKRVMISFDLSAEIDQVVALLLHYSDIPMSVADACLVRMSELHTDCLVFSTDSDFNIYRRHRDQIIPALLPPS